MFYDVIIKSVKGKTLSRKSFNNYRSAETYFCNVICKDINPQVWAKVYGKNSTNNIKDYWEVYETISNCVWSGLYTNGKKLYQLYETLDNLKD